MAPLMPVTCYGTQDELGYQAADTSILYRGIDQDLSLQ